MPRGTRKADAEASAKPTSKADPVAKQQAIVKRAEDAFAKADTAVEAAVAKLSQATYKLKLAQRELDYQRSHPDLEDDTGISIVTGIPDVKPHVNDYPENPSAGDPMADDAPPWPGDAPPKDPLA